MSLGQHPTALLRQLHELLDDLMAADLSTLTGVEHAQMVTGTVRAQSRLQAGVFDAVAAFDAADVASVSRHRTTKRWLESRTRLSAGASAGLVVQARALRDLLPATRDALAAGQISPQHVTAITTVVRTVGAEHARAAEPTLLDLARRADPAVVRRATAAIFAHVDPDGAEKALHDAYEKRGVTLSVVGEHGYLDGVFDLESTELLQSVLMPLMTPCDGDDHRSAPQRRADALLDLAKKHLDTHLMPTIGGHRPHLSVVIDADQLPPTSHDEVGDALDAQHEGPAGPSSSSGSAIGARGWVGTVSLPWTGRAVVAAAARRWACDAGMTPLVARLLCRRRMSQTQPSGLVADPAWLPLNVGRTIRTATPAQLKALAARDGGCIHPGCSRTPSYCDAHHVSHWIDGGRTDLANLVMLCRHHHRTLHTGHWSIHPDPGTPGLFWTRDPDGLHPAQTALDRSPLATLVAA